MRKKSRDAVVILDKLVGDDPRLRARIEEEESNLRIAQLVRDARAHAGLTQRQLATNVGTTQPVIARLENAEYRGHSLRMLRRIAAALGFDIEIGFVPRGASVAGRHRPSPDRKSREKS
jgi:transcriptional regulator with XRE-family HTH domain